MSADIIRNVLKEDRFMKKVVVVLVLGMVLFVSCSANYGKKIVGTWTDIENNRWVFDANGGLAYDNFVGTSGLGDGTIHDYSYVVDDSRLTIRGWRVDLQTYDISISDGGKALTLTGGNDLSTGSFRWSVAGPGMPENRLTKK
jgi:hypothetical protein